MNAPAPRCRACTRLMVRCCEIPGCARLVCEDASCGTVVDAAAGMWVIGSRAALANLKERRS